MKDTMILPGEDQAIGEAHLLWAFKKKNMGKRSLSPVMEEKPGIACLAGICNSCRNHGR